MSDRLPWFRCFPSALLGALAGLDPDESLTYVTTLLRIYETGGPVAETSKTLARRTGLAERRVIAAMERLTEAGKLTRSADGRLDSASTHDEIQWQTERRGDQSSAGKASAAKRQKQASAKKNVASALPDNQNDTKKDQQTQRTEVNGRSTDDQRPFNHLETETEKKEPRDPNGSSAPSGAVPVACRVPDGFEHSEIARRIAAEFGYAGAEIADVLGEFVDYWRPLPKTKAATKSDWPATLRNRLRELRRRNATRTRGSPGAARPRSAQDGFLSRAHEANRDLLAADYDLPMEDPDDPGPFPGDAGSLFGSGGCSNGHARPAAQQPFGGDRGLPPPRLAGPPRPH